MKQNLPRQEVSWRMRCNRPQTTHDIPTKTFNESRPKEIVPKLIIILIDTFISSPQIGLKLFSEINSSYW